MKQISILILFIGLSLASKADTVYVSGQITDTNVIGLSGFPVWVGESFYGPGNTTLYTDSFGFYTGYHVTNSTQGNLLIIVQDCVYDSIHLTVSYNAMSNVFVNQDMQICATTGGGGSGNPPCSNMSGNVLLGGGSPTDAMVYLYAHDTSGGALVDSTLLNSSGMFTFLPANLDSFTIYSLYARLLSSDLNYGLYINTYSTSATTFATADSLTCFQNQNTIIMNPLGTLSGAGYIGGATARVTRGIEVEKNVRVLLYDAQKTVIAETWSDNDGNYEFADLDNGTYFINIDLIGVEMELHEVVLANGAELDGLQILIDEQMATVNNLTGTKQTTLNEEVSVFPNPTQDIIKINVSEGGLVDYEMIDIQSRMVLSGSSDQSVIELDIQTLSEGTYQLKVVSELGQNTFKVIKN